MGGIVGGITDAIGLTDHKGQRRAQDNATKASNKAYDLSKENIDFQREQYKDWQSVYGELQENLGEHYKNLGPEKITALGLQQQQAAHQQSQDQIQRTMAQRGLGDSKFEAYAMTTADINNSNARAQIRATAEEKSALQKMSFLGIGLGQGTQMLGHVNNANNAGVNALSNQANMYNGQFASLASNNAGMMRDLTNQGSSMLGINKSSTGNWLG